LQLFVWQTSEQQYPQPRSNPIKQSQSVFWVGNGNSFRDAPG
jgi:hypothetical protein